ncbi:MAG: DNA-directed RNA polymerase subunit alpha [Planctomycetes bacterium]|nr:DNA-directed RNA polymerase subunit alpha [Planctomycetota bacterium]
MRIKWKDFELPTEVEYNSETLTDKYGYFSIEPFERGFGNTMGNSLRRILLSSIQGCAVSSIRYDGIRCEFENIKGVYEDTSEICMNIKNLCIRMHTDEPVKLKLKKKGPGEVRASDISQHQDIEVINPELLIATLNDGVDFEMEIEVRKGRGFVLARENMEKAKPEAADAFTVDSIYSPVQKVCHRVQETRVGQRTDYERLELEIWTNGVVTPMQALEESVSIMRKHISAFLSYNSAERVAKVEDELPPVVVEESDPGNEENLSLSIAVLEPSARTKNCLEAEGIQTLEQLVSLTEHELLKFRNFGQTSLIEIKEKLVKYGLTIGMKIER